MAMTYHYEECGLDNVYLENGYVIHDTSYGKGVSIHHTDLLHKLIGDWLVELPRPLTGAELRFLRLELDMTQRNLAAILGTEEQSLRRWEKMRTKPIQGPADRLLRGLYKDYQLGDGSMRKMVERLAQLDQVDTSPLHARECHDGWHASC
jgi:DNA-binding transcriptional regulator YiaG